MTYTPQVWEDVPSTDTPMSAARLNHMEAGIEANATALDSLPRGLALTAISGSVTADLTMSAGQYVFVDGSQTLTVSAPATPAHGDLLGIFIWGSGGSINFDGNGSSVVLVGNPTFPLLAPGSATVTQTTWVFDSGLSCWVVVGFGISPEVASLGGSGETGRALMAAADAAGARTALGLAAVATSGDYGDLSGKPTIPDVSGKADKTTTVSAGTGLSGGGDLSANRTLSVDYGTAAGTACEGRMRKWLRARALRCRSWRPDTSKAR